MPISIDWNTREIFVPKSYTQQVQAVPIEIRRLDTDVFRLDLRAIEASEEGVPFPRTHNHNTTVEIGGVILARVIEIINDYTVTFEDGSYAVNLVGSNNNIGDVLNLNSVQVRSANSAGLQDLSSLQAASFQGRITIDVDNGVSGTLFPTGTEGRPVNNLDDALQISQVRGIKHFRLASDLTLNQPVEDLTFEGFTAHLASALDFGGQAVTDIRVVNLTVTGSGAGSFQAEDCKLTDLSFTLIDGYFNSCGFATSIIVSTTGNLIAVDCFSEVAGADTPYIQLGGTSSLQLRGYRGGIELRSFDAGDIGSVDLQSGHLVLHTSCTGGSLVVRGVGHLTRNDGGAVTVTDLGLLSDPDGKLRRRLNLAKEADGVYREIE